MRGTRVDVVLSGVLLEGGMFARVLRVVARLARVVAILLLDVGLADLERCWYGVVLPKRWVVAQRGHGRDTVAAFMISGVFFNRGHAHCDAIAIAGAGDGRRWW